MVNDLDAESTLKTPEQDRHDLYSLVFLLREHKK